MDSRPQEGDYHLNEHEFLNADKSNLALQTQYFTDSLKNFNDIAVHSKMMLELIAKRILGQPKVIPTVYLTDGDFSPPVDEVVAIRAMVMSTQTTPVVITVNGIIPMLVSTVPTQIVTGPISSVTVGNTVPGNPVYVQYLDERAALLSNTSTQDDVAVNGTVSLTGSYVPYELAQKGSVVSSGTIDVIAATSGQFSNTIQLPAGSTYQNWAVAFVNNSGETIITAGIFSSNTSVVPNSPASPYWQLGLVSGLSVVNTSYDYVQMPIRTNPWAFGDGKIFLHWSFSAETTTTGTIDYALIGW